MKTNPSLSITLLVILFFTACSNQKVYTSPSFSQQTAHHKTIAVLPAEMIFTGTQPKNLSPEDIEAIEETESITFQNSLYNSILRHANTRKYFTSIMVQDISATQKLLEDNKISVRNSWREDDKKLAAILGVDAVVRMRVQKKRYMSDLASMGVDMGRQVLYQIGAMGKIPLPYVSNKTNDIKASCNIVSNSQTLWNDSYNRGADYNSSSEAVIDEITDNFGRHFPYKKRNG
ncbi:MAG: hypothetical protein V4676_07690 [Bacteroidota bacterium]